jgi:hypothetical protein
VVAEVVVEMMKAEMGRTDVNKYDEKTSGMKRKDM